MEDEGLQSAGKAELDRDKLRYERQKMALDLQMRRRELATNRKPKSAWAEMLANPLSLAVAGGILTLLTTTVSGFLTARQNRAADTNRAEISRDQAQLALQADLIKKFVESSRTETVRQNLKFLVDAGLLPDYRKGIQAYLNANPNEAPSLGGGVAFSPAGEAIPETSRSRIEASIAQYRIFLKGLGFPVSDTPVTVFIWANTSPIPNMPAGINAFYSRNTLYIHKALSDDPTTPLREYTHYALEAALSRPYEQNEVESAIADYLPATFLNSSIVGPGSGKILGLSTSFVRDLAMSLPYDAHMPDVIRRGIVWSEALWSCRERVGRDGVDAAMLPAWKASENAPGDPGAKLDAFASALVSKPAPVGPCFVAKLHELKIPQKVGEVP